jgi:hypothetical protein
VKVRGTEFDEVMIKLFIERFIVRLGDNDAFYAKRLMESIAFDGKDILVENEGMMKVDEVIEENKRIMEKYLILEKENRELIDETEYYVNKVIEYEHTLSKFRLDELIDEDSYGDGDEDVAFVNAADAFRELADAGRDDGREDMTDTHRARAYGMVNPITGGATRTDRMIRGIETGS